MARRSPEHRYQLPFDFSQKPEEPIPVEHPIPAGSLLNIDTREPGLGRFIRSVDEETVVQTPSIAANFLMREVYVPFEEFTQEEFITLTLDTRNRLTHTALIYRGTINAVHVRIAEIFRPAILVNARSIMLAHNHPSGDPNPSPEDVRMTELIANAGRMLDVGVLDHIVVGDRKFVSLKERGLGL